MDLGCKHSRGLVIKHVVATHDANNGYNDGGYQPCSPGAAEKKNPRQTQVRTIHKEQQQKTLFMNVIRGLNI